MCGASYEEIRGALKKLGYTEEELDILSETATKYKSTVAEIPVEEATQYLSQAYEGFKENKRKLSSIEKGDKLWLM